jgi:hypothetical protein
VIKAKSKAEVAKASVKQAQTLRKMARTQLRKSGKPIPQALKKGGMDNLKHMFKVVSKKPRS